ncbi:putative retrotransposon hot spot (RHS) protein [Trypanosoma cruzi]|uniref:Putative retrotransposon hot spot (RHS) protein n=1 Tax=Trypanosoma cruzi TaxID=5693 RepID=A0A2V2WPP5_TRYCR|nr:putative retrotransposon hot spot (RHS) protein [Trypanosoma cruzi]
MLRVCVQCEVASCRGSSWRRGDGNGSERWEPQQSWTYGEVGYTREKDGGVQQSSAARLRLMVLTSDKEWPYTWAGSEHIFDCCVNCEVDRVWQIVKGGLTELLSTHPGAYFKPKRRVLIGTPGIGKSVNDGSYLLYQLLHCDVEELQVVVHCFGETAYVFDRTTKTVSKYDINEMSRSVIPSLWKHGMKVYIIYDVAKDGRNPSFFLFLSNGA